MTRDNLNIYLFSKRRYISKTKCQVKKKYQGQEQFIQKGTIKGTWVAQLVKCLTLGLGSGYDLRVV